MALLDILKRKKKKGKAEREETPALSSVEKKSKKDEKASTASMTKAKSAVVKEKTPKSKGESFSHILLRPRITEKASLQSGGNSYTFDIAVNANKIEVKRAIREIYGISPIKVNVINMKPKKKIIRGIKGRAASFKKAVVFLKDGDSIEFI